MEIQEQVTYKCIGHLYPIWEDCDKCEDVWFTCGKDDYLCENCKKLNQSVTEDK